MAFANRGVYAETKVQHYLQWWASVNTFREFNRMVDSKAAGRIIKSAPADFEYFCIGPVGVSHGLIEVKQTEHEYRLARDKVPQLPRLRKREKCGGTSFVLVYHSTIKQWRCVRVPYLAEGGDKGSWNLTEVPTFASCGDALASLSCDFPSQTK